MKKFNLLLMLASILIISLSSCASSSLSSNDSKQTSSFKNDVSESILTENHSSHESSSNHVHNSSSWKVEPPTFIDTGLAYKTCSECGKRLDEVILPTLDDKNYQIIKDTSTCDSAGVITYSFLYKNETITFDVNTTAKGHKYEWIAEVKASTDSSGMKGHYYCSQCESCFDENHKMVEESDLIIPQISVYKFNETHHWTGENENYEEHKWVETSNDGSYKHYDCSVCDATKTEEVELGKVSSDYFLKFSQEEVISQNKKFADGIKVTATSEKTISVVSSAKSSDGIAFTHTLKLGGKINTNSRFIQIDLVSGAKLKVYALSGDTNVTRNLALYNNPAETVLKSKEVVEGYNISKLEYIISEAGTYYIGSVSGGINIYGINITLGEFCDHNISTSYSYNETNHYYKCLNAGCEEVFNLEPHNFVDEVIIPASETSSGLMRHSCLKCGYNYDEEIPMITHNYAKEYTKTETHHYFKCLDDNCDAKSSFEEHSYNNGEVIQNATIEETGLIKYTCTVCAYEKIETIPVLPSIKENKLITFSETTSITDTYNIIDGIKAVAAIDKTIEIASSSKSSDGVSFTHSLNLGGKINSNSRYIEFTVNAPCTIRIYALSGKTNTARDLGIFTGLTNVPNENILQINQVASGNTISKLDYQITTLGTYYIGSVSGGINIYGLSFTF